ncbi:MAG: thioredoxin domain-containing protein [bacterium]|nr:thioredoxin domain-containing protein [bacterium]
MEPEQTQPVQPNSSGIALTTPLAIVAAGLLIAGAVFFSRGATDTGANADNQPAEAGQSTSLLAIRPVNEATDHIRGNPNAEVAIVEYSDTECPFCKRFHTTLKQLVNEYGKSGQVAWVYRHFPLITLHSKAPKEAEALECSAELGGNTAFWNYTDSVFTLTPSNDQLDLALLPQIAEDIGLRRADFETCLSSGRYAARVDSETKEAIALGASGTPYNVLITKETIKPESEKRLRDINATLMRQLPPGTPDAIVISTDRMRVAITGAFQYPLMKEVIGLLLK